MRSGFNPSLVVLGQHDPCWGTKVDEIASQTLLRTGEQDLNIQRLALRLGFNCKGPNEICAVYSDLDRKVERGTDDFWW